MTKEKFTKGGWGVDKKYSTFLAISSGDSVVCDVTCSMDSYIIDPTDEEIANAHLIAAAPEMYEMLESLSEQDECQVFKYLINKLLAKARGEYE